MLSYPELLTAETITRLATEYEFTVPQYVERFIRCFEIHNHITQVINCVTRGGMCMPFHLPNFEVRRASVDVDLLCHHSVDEIRHVMTGINRSADGIECRELRPRNPYPLDNLVSYSILYDSCFGQQGRVKVDFFCDVDLALESQTIRPGTHVLGFNTVQSMNILSKGSLLADKITSLALGTIGLKRTRKAEIAKQIYDIGTLLRVSGREDIAAAFDTYERLTSLKLGHFQHDPPYTVSDIGISIAQSVHGLLSLGSAISITKEHTRRYDGFSGTYLSKRTPYGKIPHVADVLLVCLFNMHLQRSLIVKSSSAVDSMLAALENIAHIQNAATDERERLREEYTKHVPYSYIKKGILESANLEHVFLIKELVTDSHWWPDAPDLDYNKL